MSKITKKQFLSDVRHEIDMLKQHATDEEKGRLDFKKFDPRFPQKCIYGQLTGMCDSQRAKNLMDISCVRVFDTGTASDNGVDSLFDKPFYAIKSLINGVYDGQTWRENSRYRRYQYISVLEGYININSAKNKQIIAYIKGESEILKLV